MYTMRGVVPERIVCVVPRRKNIYKGDLFIRDRWVILLNGLAWGIGSGNSLGLSVFVFTLPLLEVPTCGLESWKLRVTTIVFYNFLQ